MASLGALLCVCLMGSAFAQERFTRQVAFDIAAQSVEAALLEFSKQADVQVMVGTTSLNGQKTEGVKGKLAVKDALQQLLRNTGLEFQTEGNSTVTIRSAAAAKTGAQVLPLVEGSRLASRDAAGEAAERERATVAESAGPTVETLDEVVVTGTHIRGQAAPVGAQLISIDRAEIAKSGFSTVQDVVRSLPQNFGGGPSEDTTLGIEADTNNIKGTAVNLRGLGAGATLVLINGRRLAPAGTEGAFTDISTIPLTAIERIDVLPDGASAIYGSDAIGGVVNFILRKRIEGAETLARAGALTGGGGADEYQVGQAFGMDWNDGSALLAYEYFDRSSLPASAKALSANSDLRRFGGDDFSDRFSNPGNIIIGSETFAIPRGQDGTSIDPASLVAGTVNPGNRNEGRDLLSSQRRHSVYATVDQHISDHVSVFADALVTRRDLKANGGALGTFLTVTPDHPFYVNPTGGTENIRVAYKFINELGPRRLTVSANTANVGAGVNWDLTSSWRLSLSGMYASEDVDQTQGSFNFPEILAALADTNPSTTFNPFGDGASTNPATLARIRGNSSFDTKSSLTSARISLDGSLWKLPGGYMRAAFGAETRKPTFESAFSSATGGVGASDFDRQVDAAFVELNVPLVGDENAFSMASSVDLSLAARYEDYSDFGSATTPKVGLAWSPLNSVTLRATWSRSFKAPNLADLDETNNASFPFETIDPLAASGTSFVLLWLGKNADLQEESATSRTIGLEFASPAVAGFRVSATYFEVDFEDRILAVPDTENWLDDPRFAGIVTRAPSAAQIENVCRRSVFETTFEDCLVTPVEAIVDLRQINTAASQVSGIDILGSYEFPTSFGEFALQLNTTYLTDYSQALTSLDRLIDLRNTPNNPIDLRSRASVSWQRDRLGMTAFINYADGYRDTVSAPNRKIGSWNSVDFQAAYKTSDGEGLWDSMELALNVQNLFDKDPPFFNNPNGIGYDPENADLLGRFVSVRLQKRW